MRVLVIAAAVALLASSGSLSAQDRSASRQPARASAVESRGVALPASLAPLLSGVTPSGEITTFQDTPGLVPVLFGVFGGVAGLFVGDWWADRDCAGPCGEGKIVMLFLGGTLGAMIGWLIDGGEIPDEGPSRRGWP